MFTIQLRRYVHKELNREVTAIGGYYFFDKEVRLPFEGGEILDLIGYAVLNTSCCGVAGCGYALVQGFVEKWQSETDDRAFPVSLADPITDHAVKRRISDLIMADEPVQ